MQRNTILALFAAALGFTTTLVAQVPSTLNYQGRIAVSGVNFSGTGQFKFALVNGAGTQTYWSNNGSSSAGSQPSAGVSIPVSSGLYNVLLGDTSLPNMTAVPAAVFANAEVKLRVWFNDGTNGFQQMVPDQRIASVGYAMMAGTVPDGSITAAKLAPGAGGGVIADGSITAAKLAPGVAAANLAAGNLSAVASGGIIGSTDANNAELLAQGFVRDPGSTEAGEAWTRMPDGDAIAGHTAVWTGTELLIWGGVVPSNTADLMVDSQVINRGMRYNPTTGVWSPLSTVGAPQARFAHSAVWTGTEMIIWGGQTSDAGIDSVLATGGRYNPTTNTWSSMAPNVSTSGPPPAIADARCRHLAFWTGTDMIIWGGSSSTILLGISSPTEFVAQGRRYNLATNTWSNIAANLPQMSGGTSWSGVWTESEMILWSHQAAGTATLPVAGRYSPAADAWQTLPRIPGDPSIADTDFTTVWTGTQMILWGGSSMMMGASNAGYRFSPATSSWTSVTTTGAPAARDQHYAAMVGNEMIIWGGRMTAVGPPPTSTTLYNDGGRYNPATNSWQSMSTSTSPPSRTEATVNAAGDKLIVWAGIQASGGIMQSSNKFLKHGGIYQTGTNAWSMLTNGSPAPRLGHTAVWTGTELIVWGGAASVNLADWLSADPTFNDGASFNPATGIWTPLPSLNAPSGRTGHSAVWTGTEMIIWGGEYLDLSSSPPATVTLNTGARYNPMTHTWTPTNPLFGPAARSKHSAVWAGSPVNQMLVWGGYSDAMGMAMLNTGSRYIPDLDTWASLTTTNAPMATSGHHCLWTGSEMIVFGGDPETVSSRYYPLSNTWLAMGSIPEGISGTQEPFLVWTGGEMLLFQPSQMTALCSSYSPIADYWKTLTNTGAPTGVATSPTSVWSGNEMIVWGVESDPIHSVITGARYAPTSDTWTSLPTTGAPAMAYGTGTWTGTEMLLWGGFSNAMMMSGTVSDKGHRYHPPQSMYLYRKP